MLIRKAIQLKMLSLDSYHKVVGQRYKKLIALHLKGHLEYSVKYLIFESSRNMARKCHQCSLLADFKKENKACDQSFEV